MAFLDATALDRRRDRAESRAAESFADGPAHSTIQPLPGRRFSRHRRSRRPALGRSRENRGVATSTFAPNLPRTPDVIARARSSR